jgi:hypothetical protein
MGGSSADHLFLIGADHIADGAVLLQRCMRAASSSSGFGFTDGFAADTARPGPALFCRTDGSLEANILTTGNSASEKVDSIFSFTGQAFTIPSDARSVLTFNEKYLLLLSDTAWVFNEKTVYKPIKGGHNWHI